MLQILKRVLDQPLLYLAFQKAYGADRLRRICIDRLQASAGERILDVGCGPAYLLEYLPAVEYVGFDTEGRYLDYARARWLGRGEFVLSRYTEAGRQQYAPFDAVLLMGLLHHLDDSEAMELLGLIARSLKLGGRVITLDPCFSPDQTRIARFMAANDRGRHVREEPAYRALALEHFRDVHSEVLHGVCRVPSTEIIMVLRAPHAEQSSHQTSEQAA